MELFFQGIKTRKGVFSSFLTWWDQCPSPASAGPDTDGTNLPKPIIHVF